MAMSDFEFMAQERTLALRQNPERTPAPRLPHPDADLQAHSPDLMRRRKRRRVLRFPVQGLRGAPEADKLRAQGRDFYNVQWRHGGAAMATGRQDAGYGMLYRKPQHECAEKSRESFRAKAAAAQRRLARYDQLVRDRQDAVKQLSAKREAQRHKRLCDKGLIAGRGPTACRGSPLKR